MNAAILLHGGTMARRAALSQALRSAPGLEALRIRVSSRAAEAAKCLADPAVVAVFLVDAPGDAEAVRTAALARGRRSPVYALEPRDGGEVVIALVREVVRDRVSDRVSDRP